MKLTREEAIAILRNQHRWTGEPEKINEVREENEALEMAIEALKQEPCEDATSRNLLTGEIFCEADMTNAQTCYDSIRKIIEELPSVQLISKSVINDIKAEIEQIVNEEAEEEKWSRGLHYALKIIDKHLAESEPQESEVDNNGD